MKLRIASDLHLEAFMGHNEEVLAQQFLPHSPQDQESVLILAGDISSKPQQLMNFLGVCSQRFKHVVFVPGNHELYRHQFQDWNWWLRKMISSQAESSVISVAADEVKTFEIEDVKFVIGTLWGDGGRSPHEQLCVQQYLNDFRLIGYAERRFKVDDMKWQNAEQSKKIESALAEKSSCRAKVVVTHHMPSYRLCHPRFGGEADGGFACNLDDLLSGNTAPNLWIHGHTHDTIDTTLWNTRIICNPAGYRGEWSTEFNRFSPLFVDV